MIHAAAQFSHVNFDVLTQPRVNIRLDDGRNFLLRTRTPERRRIRSWSNGYGTSDTVSQL